MSGLVTKPVLENFLRRVSSGFGDRGSVYLIGETSQVWETWRSWTPKIELTSVVPDHRRFARALSDVMREMDLNVIDEFPGDLIPLPEGYERRSRPITAFGGLDIRHFDPYSTAYRFIARGDEPDYHLVLSYVHHGWIDIDEMNERLDALLPRFSMDTIQQDPAEFRRKYKGLMQMARSIVPGSIHRHTPV